MNFTKIDGVDVTVRVNDADEARHALKELRLARKQTLHEKRGLARDLKEAEAREEKPAKRRRSRGEIVESPGGYVWRSLIAVAKLATGEETERRPEPEERKPPTASSLERQIAAANALIHNLDAVILEIEARLLKEKAKRS